MGKEPTPLGFVNNGNAYIQAARQLSLKGRIAGFTTPIDQCLGIGLEIVCKGLLLASGEKTDDLKKRGHNLQALFDAVDKAFPSSHTSVERHVREYWKGHLRKLRDVKEKKITRNFDVNDPNVRELLGLPTNEDIGKALMSFQKCLLFLNQGYSADDHYRYFSTRLEERVELKTLPNHFDMIRESLIQGGQKLVQLGRQHVGS
ncbi:hypothetical protein [Roseobacter sp.]|uniref:hypothetical protein n=1 Tax=Roseobacter sp. TaxID=1907202 RepID=UPI0029676D48|nr:hypothetical protein [Roseobacter sp.]MDW3183498.1 hypothetical protein [Roseobacter sp.]